MEGAIALAAVGVVAEGFQAKQQAKGADEEEEAVNLQGKEKTIEMQQKQLSNYDVMEKTLDTQTAQAAARGFTLSSPSFNAIQRNTMNVAAKEAKNIDLEQDLNSANTDIEQQNIRDTLHAQFFSDISQAALMGSNVASKFPTTGT